MFLIFQFNKIFLKIYLLFIFIYFLEYIKIKLFEEIETFIFYSFSR